MLDFLNQSLEWSIFHRIFKLHIISIFNYHRHQSYLDIHMIWEILSASIRSIIFCIVALSNCSSNNLNQYCCRHKFCTLLFKSINYKNHSHDQCRSCQNIQLVRLFLSDNLWGIVKETKYLLQSHVSAV